MSPSRPDWARLAARTWGFVASETSGGRVGEQEVERNDVIGGLAVDNGVTAAGVVANAAADSGTIRGGRIDGVVEAMIAKGAIELGQHNTGLDAGPALRRVDLDDAVHVRRKVEDDGVVEGLTCKARAGAAWQDGQSALRRHAQHVGDIGSGAGIDDGDRLHLIDRGVGGVKEAGRAIDLDASPAAGEAVGDLGSERMQGGIASAQQVESSAN